MGCAVWTAGMQKTGSAQVLLGSDSAQPPHEGIALVTRSGSQERPVFADILLSHGMVRG